MNTILMILASQGFRDIEYLVPKAFFEQQGWKVQTASSAQISKGRFGYEVHNEFLLKNVSPSGFEGLYMVGGVGASEYQDNEEAKSIALAFLRQQKPIAAICAAPKNFLAWGLLTGKKAIGFNTDGVFADMALKHGAHPLPNEPVVIDGLILTANGPEASEKSALEYIKLLHSTS